MIKVVAVVSLCLSDKRKMRVTLSVISWPVFSALFGSGKLLGSLYLRMDYGFNGLLLYRTDFIKCLLTNQSKQNTKTSGKSDSDIKMTINFAIVFFSFVPDLEPSREWIPAA